MNRRKLAKCFIAGLLVAATPVFGATDSAVAEASNVKRGGTLHIALLGLDTADPHRHSGSIAVQQVFAETLTSIADDGRVTPFLAERFEVSEDGRRYTFHLRHGVKFHNGREMTATDIKANFLRVKEKVTGGWLSGAMELVSTVDVPDAYTVVVSLSESYAPFLNLISELWILAPESEGWTGTISRPIGTGPFMFGDWKPTVSFKAPAFSEYWQKGLPYLDAVEFDLKGDRDNSLGLRSGDLHVGYVANDKIETLRKADFDVQFLKDTAWYFLSFNNRKPSPLMADVRVRKAIAHALDKTAYMNFIAPSSGVAGNQPLRPNTVYWDEAMEKDDVYTGANLDAARQLLTEAGVDPSKHTLKVVSWQNDYAQVAVQMVRQLGFNVDHQALDDIGAQKLLGEYDWDLAPFHSGPRADVYLRYARFLTNGPSPMLWGGIQDAELDALIGGAVSAPNAEAARAGYLRAWERVMDKHYTIGIGHAPDAIGVSPEVRGYQTGYTWSQNRADGGVARTWLAAQ